MGKRTNTAVWMNKYQRWQIKVQKDGKRRTFTSSKPTRTGQRECNAKADAWLDENIDNTNKKFESLYTIWINELKIATGTSHWKKYDAFGRNYILPKLGHRRIGSICEQDLQDILLYAYKTGNHGTGLSDKTLRNLRACLIAFIKYARKNNVTNLLPEDLKIPRNAVKGTKDILQPHDLKLLFKHDQNMLKGKYVFEWFIFAYRFAVVTGLRPGELVGLQNKDIEQSRCTIQRSINIYNEITRGKNENARRSFLLPSLALDILNQQRLMLKKANVISPFVFPGQDGCHATQQTYYKHWIRFRQLWNISDTTPYELRHTWYSVNKKIPTELIKAMGGHGKDFDTFGVYGHEVDGDADLTARLIDATFRNILSPKD